MDTWERSHHLLFISHPSLNNFGKQGASHLGFGGSPPTLGSFASVLGPSGGGEEDDVFEYANQPPRDDPAKPTSALDDMESPAAPGEERVRAQGDRQPQQLLVRVWSQKPQEPSGG